MSEVLTNFVPGSVDPMVDCAKRLLAEGQQQVGMQVGQTGGRKDDSWKLRFDLVPGYPLSLLADVYTRGAKKYTDRNWEKGIAWGRIFAAMMRHAWKWFCGERLDPVDGQHHLASVAWCAFALMEYEQTHPELDDRPRKVTLGLTVVT